MENQPTAAKPPHVFRALIPSKDPIAPGLESISVNMGGNITIENPDGTTANMRVLAGQQLERRPYKIIGADPTVKMTGVFRDDAPVHLQPGGAPGE